MPISTRFGLPRSSRFARGRGNALALLAWDRADPDRLIGLMPVRWARRALALPAPFLIGWNGYASLAVPTLDRDHAVEAAGALLDAARAAGAYALFLPGTATEGEAFAAMKRALSERGLSVEVMRSFRRAGLKATQDTDMLLRSALSAKKLKELRRQRHRLEEHRRPFDRNCIDTERCRHGSRKLPRPRTERLERPSWYGPWPA